jgi:hypothetical protein
MARRARQLATLSVVVLAAAVATAWELLLAACTPERSDRGASADEPASGRGEGGSPATATAPAAIETADGGLPPAASASPTVAASASAAAAGATPRSTAPSKPPATGGRRWDQLPAE